MLLQIRVHAGEWTVHVILNSESMLLWLAAHPIVSERSRFLHRQRVPEPAIRKTKGAQMKTGRVWFIAMLLLVVGGIASWWFTFHAGGGPPIFTISEQTTHVTGPVDSDGYIDYAAALNDRLGKGIAAKDNANVLIVKVVGPSPSGTKLLAEFYERLGIPEPPTQGDYFTGLSAYLDRHVKFEPGTAHTAKQDILDMMLQLMETPWKSADHPHVQSWLKANEQSLVVAVQAANRRQYYLPLVPKRDNGKREPLMNALMPAVQMYREMASAFTIRAMQRLDEGRCDEAWQDLLACHRLGRLVSRGATLIEGLVGIAIDVSAAKADVAFLAHAAIDARQIQMHLEDLKKLPPLGSIADKIDLGARFNILDSLMFLDRGTLEMGKSSHPAPLTGKVDWDPALRQINGYYDGVAAALRTKDYKIRKETLDQLLTEIGKLHLRMKSGGVLEKLFMTRQARGQHMGDLLTSLMVPAFSRVVEAEERAQQTQRNLYVAFALAAYHRDHGRYPQTLPELAPMYIDNLPDDMFTNGPLNYRPNDEGYLLYSVGPNGRDDDGGGREVRSDLDDISVRMPPGGERKVEQEKAGAN